jgi:GAF domain-containing protein
MGRMIMSTEADYFRTFCEISKAFGTTLATEKLLDMIVASAVKSLKARAACLFLSDRNKDLFVIRAQYGLSDNYLHADPQSARKIVQAALKAGYLHIYDATSDPRVEHHELKKKEGIASILDVPVIVRDQAIGILALYTAEHREFSKVEIDFLKALAEQGGIALEHARLVERINNNAQIFLELASKINGTLNISQIVRCLSEDTCHKLGMKASAIQLDNSSRQKLETAFAHGLSDAFASELPVLLEGCALKALSGEIVRVEDCNSDPFIEHKNRFSEEGLGALISVPIQSRHETVGVLHLFSAKPRRFPADLQMIINALAHTGALAIRNAAMYLQLQKDKESLEADVWAQRNWF